MMLPKSVNLLYAPANSGSPVDEGVEVAADIMELTDAMVLRAMGNAWWEDGRINPSAAAGEIDRMWSWDGGWIEHQGHDLEIERVAVVTGDGAVQGVMFLTVASVAMEGGDDRGRTGLFIERLFAAPRNRPPLLGRPNQPIYFGPGRELLGFAVERSRERGCEGRLKLDASPGAFDWYQRRGLRAVPGARTVFESTEYAGMELSAPAAQLLVQPTPKTSTVKGASHGSKK